MSAGVVGAAAGESMLFEMQVVAGGAAERTFRDDCISIMFNDEAYEVIPPHCRTQALESRSFRQLARASSRMWKELDDLCNYPTKMFQSLTNVALRTTIADELDSCPRRSDTWSRAVHGTTTL